MVMVKDEPTKTAENAAQIDQSSQKSAEGTPKTEPRTYTEEEVEALAKKKVNDALMIQGREHKRVLVSAVSKAQQEAQTQLVKLQQANGELQEALDEMAADDEDKTRTAKLLKDNLRRERELEARVQAYEPKIAKAEEYELTELCNIVAKDYDGADAARLKRIASRTKFSDDEDKEEVLRSLADDIWAKKTVTPAKEPPKEEPRKVDSGITTGKTGLTLADVAKMSTEEQRRRRAEIAAIPFS